MNLAIDIGNTRVKIAMFEGTELKLVEFFLFREKGLINEFINKCKVQRAIISAVVDDVSSIVDNMKSHGVDVIEFNSTTKIPIGNLYKTASTLGNDRIPSVIAAHSLQPAQNLLVIDAGTCIKYNFLSESGDFLGGAISPGLKMRFKALHTFTSRLPLIETDQTFEKLIGTDTRESILAGVQSAAVAEVNEMIAQYGQQFSDLNVFLTGGDSAFFEKRLKNTIFADPNLVLIGLNIILNYNA